MEFGYSNTEHTFFCHKLVNSLEIENLQDILNSWRKTTFPQQIFTKNTSYCPTTWPVDMRGKQMAPEPRNCRRLKRHWRPPLFALCVLGATWGTSFAMPKVEAARQSELGFLKARGCDMFFVGPRKKEITTAFG